MHILDRLIFAVIGAVAGVIIAIVFWWLYGLAFSSRMGGAGDGIDTSLLNWIMPASAIFAILGFVFKDHLGSIFGGLLSEIYRAETEEPRVPAWLAVVLLLGIVVGAFYLLQ